MTPQQKRTLHRALYGALTAHAQKARLPLTVVQVQGLAAVVSRAVHGSTVSVPNRSPVDLTQQQFQMLRALAAGETTPETAWRLGLSEHTVKTHKAALYGRLGARTSAHAVSIAVALDLITMTPATRRSA